MPRTANRRTVWTLVLTTLAIALIGASAPVAANGEATTRAPGTTDLTGSLGADGTFTGTPGLEGAVDTSEWALTSDLAAGEAPRFGRASGTPRAPGDWAALGNGATGVAAIAVSGSNVYVAGSFLNVAGIADADLVAKWDGTSWSALGAIGGADHQIFGWAIALAVSGTNVYLGGNFQDAADIATADYVAKWNGTSWSALGSNGAGNGALNSHVYALAVLGPDLFVGGKFTNASGADNLARWDGTGWSSVGSSGFAINDDVLALAVSGSDLYVGGYFNNAAGVPEADWIAKWSGAAWSALGSNGAGNGVLNGPVYALAVGGSDLYVGGYFGNIGGMPTADSIARWTGSAWAALGSNGAGDGVFNSNSVMALAVIGSDLYVGGDFNSVAGNVTASHVVRFDGTNWVPLGGGGGALDDNVQAFGTLNGKLYIGGAFDDAAGIPAADGIVRYSLGSAIVVRKPDGRIQLGTGPFVGNNVYNTNGTGQSRTGSAGPGNSITFGMSIQNDATGAADSFKVKATGTATSTYNVKYFRNTTDITAAVVAGTYQTPSLAPGAAFLITAKVIVKAGATVGSNVTRLVKATSVADITKKDTVKFVAKRA